MSRSCIPELVIAAALLAGCKKQSEPVRVDPPSADPPPSLGSDVAAVAAPRRSNAERVKPPKQLAWARPTRAATEQEQLLAGTWAATVGADASRSLVMADQAIIDLETMRTTPQSCIWLELRPDFTGFRRECMLVDGVPSALDQNDPITGAKQDFGTKLEWFQDTTDKGAIKIWFAADMVVPAPKAADGKPRELVFRHWTLRLSAGSGDDGVPVEESFPEHDYTLPTKSKWIIKSGAYLD